MPSLNEIMVEAAQHAGFFWRGTTSGAGSATTLVDTALIDSERPDTMGKGGFLYIPAAGAAERQRRVSGVAADTGVLTNAGKPWTVAGTYAGAQPYQWYGLVPAHEHSGEPFSWAKAVNRGLEKVWFEGWDESMFGTSDGQDRFDVSAIPGVSHAKQIRGVEYRNINQSGALEKYNDWNVGKYGGFWRRTGKTEIYIYPSPSTLDYMRFNYVRPYVVAGLDDLVDDDDETDCPMDVAWKAALSELYQYLDLRHGGRWAGESARAQLQFVQAYSRIRPADVVLMSD